MVSDEDPQSPTSWYSLVSQALLAPLAYLLKTPRSPKLDWYWDSGASFSTCADLDLLYDVVDCDPFPIGGIGPDPLQVNKVGRLRFLPPAINKCYYTPSASVNLVSLGYCRRHGLSYDATSVDPDLPLRLYLNGELLLSAPMASNNLHPISAAVLSWDYTVTNSVIRSYPSLLTVTPTVTHPALAASRLGHIGRCPAGGNVAGRCRFLPFELRRV